MRLWVWIGTISVLGLVLVGCRTGSGAGAPFRVTVEGDRTVTLPLEGRYLAEVSFTGPTFPVETTWALVTGPGTVAFGSDSEPETSAVFTVAGDYVLEATARGSGHLVRARFEVTVVEAGTAPVVALSWLRSTPTGFGLDGEPLAVASIDPAGVVYHVPSDRLLLVDSEINEVAEVFARVQANLFETPRDVGSTLRSWDLLSVESEPFPPNHEPTGIAHCEADDRLYVTNDDRNAIYRYALEAGEVVFEAIGSTEPHSIDPKGISCDGGTGDLYVLSGVDARVLVYRYQGGFRFVRSFALGPDGPGGRAPLAPEGIAFDPANRHLFVVSDPDKVVVEYTLDGTFVQSFDLLALGVEAVDPQGLSLGPSTRTEGATSLFVVDGGIDNGADPDERDGAVHELELLRASP